MLLDDDPSFMRELVRHHVSGQLRVAPEHASSAVLDVMEMCIRDSCLIMCRRLLLMGQRGQATCPIRLILWRRTARSRRRGRPSRRRR